MQPSYLQACLFAACLLVCVTAEVPLPRKLEIRTVDTDAPTGPVTVYTACDLCFKVSLWGCHSAVAALVVWQVAHVYATFDAQAVRELRENPESFKCDDACTSLSNFLGCSSVCKRLTTGDLSGYLQQQLSGTRAWKLRPRGRPTDSSRYGLTYCCKFKL
jgi:hypothetical protein